VQVLGRELDAGSVVGVDLGQGAKKQAADVGEHGRATNRDAVLGQELIEVVEGMVDALGRLEVVEVPGEVVVVVGGFDLLLLGAMPGAEAGAGIGDRPAALAA
jgi:hypothetical protein